MQGERPGGPDQVYVDRHRRASLMALFDDGFPGLPAKIATAKSRGFDWDAVTWPYVHWEGERAVAHVGILEHRVRLMGQDVLVAGMHAVATASDHRRRGLCRRLQEEALRWADEHYDLAKLSTDDPPVYEGQGFRLVPTHRFRLARGGDGGAGARPFADADRAAFLELCPHRDPVSHMFSSLDPGWLVGIDLALRGRSLADLWVLDELGCVVDWDVTDDGVLRLHDVFAEELPELDAILTHAPAHREVLLCVGSDRLAPHAVAEPFDSGLMVRGSWPIPADVPFTVSRLAEH